MKSLGTLLEGLVPLRPPERSLSVPSLSLDSRHLAPGGWFLACRGRQRHGLAYGRAVGQRGAAGILAEPDATWDRDEIGRLGDRLGIPAIPVPELGTRVGRIADRFFDQPSARLSVIGVTGTNGKSSVTHFIAQALAPQQPCGLIGTLGIGFPGALRPSTHTTPDPIHLHQALAELAAAGARTVAMEVSSHALDQGRVDGVRFTQAILTNLSRDHLDYHGTLAAYGRAKTLLFQRPELDWAFLNLDDPLARAIQPRLPPDTALGGYSLDPRTPIPSRCALWVRARHLASHPEGLRLTLETSHGTGVLESPLLGRFNGANLLAALLVLLARGEPLPAALAALGRVRGVPGRMESFRIPGRPRVVVDYAHTPDALKQALQNLRPHVRGRLITVFGCGGERDSGKRPLMGAIAEELSDGLILTDDNPRGEDGDRIIQGIRSGMRHPENAAVQRHRSAAIEAAIAQAGPEDLVLVAGKGHETVQECAGQRIPFSDRDQVRAILGCRGGEP